MTEPRALCNHCERPLSVCVCAALVRVPTRTRIVILQHPRERRVPIGTARLAELAFPNAVRHVGIDFSEHPGVRGLLSGAARPVLLYPGASDEAPPPPSAQGSTLVVLDGTWWQAEKLFKTNAFLDELPRIALNPTEPSRYRIRREPAAHCMSTIEAIVQALCMLEGDPSVSRALAPFDAMVETQLRFAQRRQRRHVRKQRAPRTHPLERLLDARRSDLVVAYGEANAWPKRSPLGHAPEIVHWAALRPFGGERFEALIAPRRPLSPSFELQTGVSGELVRAGEPWESFCHRWQAFARPTDILCTWGHFAAELLRSEGATLPERIDVRTLVRAKLRRKPGDVNACASALGSPVLPSGVPGRTGLRLDGLAAVVRALVGCDANAAAE